jgi:hypothetical protein
MLDGPMSYVHEAPVLFCFSSFVREGEVAAGGGEGHGDAAAIYEREFIGAINGNFHFLSSR